MSAGWAALGFAMGVLSYAAVTQIDSQRREPCDPDQVRAQTLADAWWAVRGCRLGPEPPIGPDSFRHGILASRAAVEELPGFDQDVVPTQVSAYHIRQSSAQTTSRSARIGGDPGGVGSTNRGPNPHHRSDRK